MDQVTVVDHPLVHHHLTRLRDVQTEPGEFRLLLQRLATLVAFEATRQLELVPRSVQTPLARHTGHVLLQRVGLVPILRAGLSMVEPLLHWLPTAEVWHLGLYRDETTALPVEYYRKLPPAHPVDVAFILDPMLATGGSASLAIEALRDWGVPEIRLLSIIACEVGIRELSARHPDALVFTAALDPELNEHKFIVPGLGDAGDRAFGTRSRENGP